MPSKLRDLHDRSSGLCTYCGCLTKIYQQPGSKDDAATRDHRIPRSSGHRMVHDRDNIVLACRLCNMLKGSMTAEEFRNRRTRLLRNLMRSRRKKRRLAERAESRRTKHGGQSLSGGKVDAPPSKSGAQKACRFESDLRHHTEAAHRSCPAGMPWLAWGPSL